ncbi:alpha-amylase family glycosyl hydrolase [Aldersonia sp. NBC_00410]|uniref:alpha-amylase family glycosyl hydrolase n=1 Tax=Aldersonia sp. NBC_00410 TaxID=2975954 RepID=UPI00225330EF|nr:alpha-amylase family glycosyl hydrolase [Aldersonia sp. NBC_00410]MCX5045243.1 alpha-amylase family glycosyl hydrolase [Aldersonia sp. NBC_00410]
MTSGEPSWVYDALWWQVYPLSFVGAPVRPTAGEAELLHRLSRIEAWLDHVVELGLNGLLLGPIFASSTHGYDVIDHRRIDPRLGDDADFDRLLTAAHDRGIRVILDGVFNHVGRAHPAFRAVEQDGPEAATAGLFAVDWNGWQPGDPVRANVFEGHDNLVEVNHNSPAAEEFVGGIIRYWLDRGVDGWRLDAAYSVPDAFWHAVLSSVRRDYPDAWFLGEVIHGDYTEIVRNSAMHALTQYELWQGLWHAVVDRNFFELSHALGRHRELLDTFVPATFVGNHDVTRIASAVGPEFVPHTLAVLFTVAGTPIVYAGDEYAMLGIKEERHGGDDAVRPEFASTPTASADLDDTARQVVDIHRQLIGLRRRHHWLHEARTDVLEVNNLSLALRAGRDADAVVTVLNIDDEQVELPAGGAARVAAGSAEIANGRARLPARGWAVLTT